MTEWILPCNPKYYRVSDAFKEQKIIDWRQTNNTKNIQDGDVVYIYLSSPNSSIVYKGAVLKAGKAENTLDDSVYSIPPGSATSGPCMEIALFRVYELDGLDINTLKANGLTSNLQCPVSVKKELSNYLHACDKLQKTSDRLVGEPAEECLVPFPIRIDEGGIEKSIPLAPLEIKDELVTCANCYKKFKKVDKCPFCGQLMIYPKRFFGTVLDS